MRAAPRLPRCEGAGKLPILGNLTEGVYDLKKYTPPVSFADIPLKTRGTRDCAFLDSEINNHFVLVCINFKKWEILGYGGMGW